MAKHSYERARWNRREVRRRMMTAYFGYDSGLASMDEEHRRETVRALQRRLNQSIHLCMSQASRKYRRLWRRQGRRIGQLHLLAFVDEAENLEPQPRRLGVMWDIW